MKTHRIIIVIALLGALVASTPALAQRRGRGAGNGKGRLGQRDGLRGSVRHDLMKYLYPIGLIRHYASDIKLTEEQTKKLRKVVTDVNAEIESLKWDVEREGQKLLDLVKSEASKDAIYAQMDLVFKFENKIKKKHLGLMIVARDILNKKQQKFLDEVKDEFMKRRGRGGPPPGHGPPPPHGPNPGF
ncbi:MAG: hypothetical protein GY854_00205 [Deltaproteobacteria bacterium]|nr:hypothetical protein [Deltaproteobacteria bacterium]